MASARVLKSIPVRGTVTGAINIALGAYLTEATAHSAELFCDFRSSEVMPRGTLGVQILQRARDTAGRYFLQHRQMPFKAGNVDGVSSICRRVAGVPSVHCIQCSKLPEAWKDPKIFWVTCASQGGGQGVGGQSYGKRAAVPRCSAGRRSSSGELGVCAVDSCVTP